MRRIFRGQRPSPAMFVAVVALVMAVAGTAVAGVATISLLTKKEKKQVKKIVNKRAAKLTVKNAKNLGGLPPSAYVGAASSGYQAGSCDPTSTTFLNCASTNLSLPHAGQVLLVAGGGQNSFGGAAEGTCEFRVDGALSSAPSVDPGEVATDNTSLTAQNGFAVTTVTGNLAAAAHTFNLACNERAGDFEAHDTTISAILVG